MRCRRWLAGPLPWTEPDKGEEVAVKGACRICHSHEESREDPLVAPCLCDGSLKYVHNSCQQGWLKHRRGPPSYNCELCRAPLACRLTLATRLEILAVCTASAVVWAVQASSTFRIARLALGLLVARWHQAAGERPSSQLQEDMANEQEVVPNSALVQLAVVAAVALLANNALSTFKRPLVITGEEALSRFCIVKIGGSILLLLHEVLWAFPPVQRVAPFHAWRVISATLLTDTLLLAFFRIPREERSVRAVVPRVLLGACRITMDFLPFAAVFFLWSASIVMIMAASMVPCMVLLFHEAVRDVRRRRHQHGSLQVVALLLRAAVRLVGVLGPSLAGPVWRSCDRLAAGAWFSLEAGLLWDVLLGRCRVCCVRETSSQVFWTASVLGQAGLVALDQLWGLGPSGLSHSSPQPGHRGWWPVLPLPRQQQQQPVGRGPAWPTHASPGVQEVALLLCIAAYVGLHSSVFASWLTRGRQAASRLLASVEPDRVVFTDRLQPRGLH